jgi:hypothetical protein
MVREILLFVGVVFCATSYSQSKSLFEFTSVATSGNIQVDLKKGNVLKAEYKILAGREEDLYIEVTDGILEIKIKSQKNGMTNASETKAKVTVYYDEIYSLDCSAGSSITAENEIIADNMHIDSGSGAKCSVKLKSKTVTAKALSGSKINLSGTASNVRYVASSGGRITASELIAVAADADVSSGGDISLHAGKKLKADASSGGIIKYKGNPESTNFNSGMSGSIKSISQ